MGRLFLRLFVGIMMMQFGIRQWMNYDETVANFPTFLFLDSSQTLVLMVFVEIFCSIFIMFGCLTRLMSLPPFISMCVAEYYILHDVMKEYPYMLSWSQMGYVPILFLGIYFFIILVGPGKISVDYFLSLHFIHSNNHSETELEEV